MKITTRIGRLNDPRITKTETGYVAAGVPGVFRTWLLAFEAMDACDPMTAPPNQQRRR